MLTYHPETFDSLNSFETARQELETHHECINELGSVIRKHNVHSCVGVYLLHKHFDLADTERLVEGFANGKRCCRAQTVSDAASVTPYLWKVGQGNSREWHYHPLEFLPTGDQRLDFSALSAPVMSNKEFLAEMAARLLDLRLSDTFGISLLHRDAIPRSRGEILVETTDEDARMLLFSVVQKGTVDPATLTQTLWQFDKEMKAAQECWNHCSHCKHCYNHPY